MVRQHRHEFAAVISNKIGSIFRLFFGCRRGVLGDVVGLIAGCQLLPQYPGDCTIVVGETHIIPLDVILRHEYAHCNGWGADHEP